MAEGLSPPLYDHENVDLDLDSCRVMTDSDDSIMEKGAIHQLLSADKIPPMLKKVGLPKIKELYDNCRDIHIIMTGITGSGKSVLANALLGNTSDTPDMDMFKEGSSLHPCTQEVVGKKSRRNHKIKLTVWDSPGLKDGTSKKHQKAYLEEVASVMRVHDYDLSVHCIKADTRFVDGEDNGPVQVMKILTKKYGNEFWKKTVIVLTFANTIETYKPEWKKLGEEERITNFHKHILEYDHQIRKNLEKCAKVKKEIVNQIQIIPAGHYSEPKLFDRSYWLSALWFQCLDTIPALDAKASLVRYYQSRLVEEEDPLQQNPENCCITLDDPFVPRDFLQFKRKYARIGAGIGAGIGTLGFFGVFLTIPLGYWRGGKWGEKEYITKNCHIEKETEL